MDETLTTTPAAPLPVLSGMATGTEPNAARNEWHAVGGAVSFSAEVIREFKQVTKPPASRSSFRTGEIAFGSDGIQLNGQEVRPDKRVQTFVSSIYMIFLAGAVVIQVICQIVRTKNQPLRWEPVSTILVLTAIFSMWQYLADRHRFPAEARIAWSAVRALQVEPRSRWATLIYEEAATGTESKPVFRALTLDIKAAHGVAKLADAAEQFAPGTVTRVPAPAEYEWTKLRIAYAVIIVSTVIALFVTAFILSDPHPP